MLNHLKSKLLLFTLCLFGFFSTYAYVLHGQVIQINTYFSRIVSAPTWLLILRDINSGTISPYIYDIYRRNNFWIAINPGHTYQIMASELKFNRYAVIHNFCRLQNRVLSGKSMIITLTGQLSPNRCSSTCQVTTFVDTNNTAFQIVDP